MSAFGGLFINFNVVREYRIAHTTPTITDNGPELAQTLTFQSEAPSHGYVAAVLLERMPYYFHFVSRLPDR